MSAAARQNSDDTGLLQLFLTELQAPVLVLDRSRRVTHCSSSLKSQFALQVAPEPGVDVKDALQLLPNSSLLTAINEALETRLPVSLEPTISNKFLGTRIIPSGELLVLIFEDSSARQELEQIRWELVDGLAHNFLTPLASISLAVETIERGGEGAASDRTGVFLQRIKNRTQRLIRCCTDLLVLCRLEKSEYSNREEIELGHLLGTVTKAHMLDLSTEGIELQMHLPRTPIYIHGNSKLLDSAFSNLFENAVKYNRYGGSVSVAMESRGAEVVVTFEDSGIGIEPEALPHIFERFYRSDSARSGDRDGTGLGLPIVRAVVELHDGRITAFSTLGQGSRFIVTLPRLI